MERRAGNEAERPLIGEAYKAQDEVDYLECRHGLDSAVQVLGEEVPEDLGPEEALDGGSQLVCGQLAGAKCCGGGARRTGGSREDDEASPVVFD